MNKNHRHEDHKRNQESHILSRLGERLQSSAVNGTPVRGELLVNDLLRNLGRLAPTNTWRPGVGERGNGTVAMGVVCLASGGQICHVHIPDVGRLSVNPGLGLWLTVRGMG